MKSLEIKRYELYAIIESLANHLKKEIDSTVDLLQPFEYPEGHYNPPHHETLKLGEERIKEQLERLLALANEHQKWRDEELLK